MIFLLQLSLPDPLVVHPHLTGKLNNQRNRQNNRAENRSANDHHFIHQPSSSSQAHSSSNTCHFGTGTN
jgi:hypothetical protein